MTENLERIVNQRTEELKRSNDDLQQFAHVASHDLKEPLRKVRTFGGLLKVEFRNSLPEKAKGYIDKMGNAADRMQSMIDGILDYSGINSSEDIIEDIDLNNIIENIKGDLEVVIEQKSAVLEYKGLPVIEGSTVLINQLFYNLINNALKFVNPGVPRVIVISSRIAQYEEVKNLLYKADPQQYFAISIADNGIGFKQDQAEKIFNTFVRLFSKDKYEGTGLGLSLCQKIADRHAGLIIAKGEENKGAVFTLYLPLKQPRNMQELK